MSAKEIFSGTLAFCWLNLALGMAAVLISAFLFVVLVLGFGALLGVGSGGWMLFVWLVLTGAARYALVRYLGRRLQAGYVGVIAVAYQTGTLPGDPVEAGKNLVMQRFGTFNGYVAVDRLVSGSIWQLQRVLRKTANLLDFAPRNESLARALELFLNAYIGYVKNCCLGLTFLMGYQSAYKSAADGVAIYWQNAKRLLKNAVKTAAAAVGLTAACCLAFFLLLRLPLRLMELSGSWSFAAFVLALLAAWAVKNALIDSWVLVKTMPVYLESASKTPLSYDLYGKLCSLSPRFQELLRRGAPPQPAAPQQAYWAQQAYQQQAYYRQPYAQQTVSQAHAQPSAFPVICPVCGNRIEPGKRFCAVCGNQLYPPGA